MSNTNEAGKRKSQESLSYERLRETLDYHMETGAFFWRIPRRGTKASGNVGSIDSNGYLDICIDGRHYPSHRLAWFWVTGRWPEADIDHINGFRLDNRFQNLREATRAQNLANRRMPKHNTSGYKGIVLHKPSGRWIARIAINRQVTYLGYFDTAEDAHLAYARAAAEHHGKFARLK